MSKKVTIREATRTVGYLLETNGHVGWTACTEDGRDAFTYNSPGACRWCLAGAEMLVGKYLLGDAFKPSFQRFVRKVLNVPKGKPSEYVWEGPGTNDQTRKQIIAKLKNA